MNINEFIMHFSNVKKEGKGYKAQCTAHDDRKNSLSISEGENGNILIHCHAGCKTEDIILTARLEMKDLFNNSDEYVSKAKENRDNGNFANNIEKEYLYHNEAGQVVYKKIRTKNKEFYFHRVYGDKIITSLKGGTYYKLHKNSNIYVSNAKYEYNGSITVDTEVQHVLYNLHNLIKANNNETIYIVEGEKDCDNLINGGLIATTSPTGAGDGDKKWNTSFNSYFRGKNIVIIPDADEPGWNHALNVLKNISSFANKVRILELKGLQYKEDVSDWLDYGHTIEELKELSKEVLEKDTDIITIPENIVKHSEHGRLKEKAEKLGLRPTQLKIMEEMQKARKQYADYGDWNNINEKTGRITAVKPGRLANYIMTKHDIFTLHEDVFIYTDGVYKQWNIVHPYIDSHISDELVTREKPCFETLSALKNRTTIEEKDVKYNTGDLINVKNCIIEVDTKKSLPHDSKHKFITQINANYDPTAECPRFMQYLDEAVDKENHIVIQELLGYLLTNETRAKKFFVLQGPTNTGKSVFLNLVSSLYDKEFVSHQSLQNLANDKYSAAYLHGKMLNICGDLPAKPLEDDGVIKMLTGEDTIEASRKYKNDIKVLNKAKLLFSANTIPSNYSGDKSNAFYNRLLILPFHKKPKRKDEYLTEKLIKELPGIINWALDGLIRLKANNYQITETPSIIKQRELYKVNNNNVLRFITENEIGLTLDPDYYTISSSNYSEYKSWCEENRYKALTSGGYATDLQELGVKRIRARVFENDPEKQITVFVGLRCLSPMLNKQISFHKDSKIITDATNKNIVKEIKPKKEVLNNINKQQQIDGFELIDDDNCPF